MLCKYCGGTYPVNGVCPLCGHLENESSRDDEDLLSSKNITYERHRIYPMASDPYPSTSYPDDHPKREKTIESRNIPKSVRFQVLARDNYTCQYCGKKAPEAILEVDHMVSWKDGGRTSLENLITSCRDCNRGKSSKSISHATSR